MIKDAENYISRIQSLGLNNINPIQLKNVEVFFGAGFLDPATNDQKDKAKKYLHGHKKDFEAGFAWVVWNSFGKVLSSYAAEQISMLAPGSNGYYVLNVGFNGKTLDIQKIQTLKPGSDMVNNGLFEGASFSNEDEYIKDKILPGKLPKILRSGIDETTQLDLVAKGYMFLIGPRGYSRWEHLSNEVLYSDINNPALNNSDLVKRILTEHQYLVYNGIKPGIANPRSCLYAPDTSHMVRMALDVSYLEKASAGLDFKILTSSLFRRAKRVVRVLEHMRKKENF